MEKYYPEGILFDKPENQKSIRSIEEIINAEKTGKILEAYASVCDKEHNLIVDLPCIKGIIPRNEGAFGIDDGSTKDVALISRVNKPVCFKVMSINTDSQGNPVSVNLSRRAAQMECFENYICSLDAGDIIDAVVTHIEQFGCFVDIGCGIPSLIPVDAISVSRISNPSDRFYISQKIRVIVKDVDKQRKYPRVNLTHKELLGTWSENAELFNVGETVAGIVRSVESYGIFVELTPNLAGLAELREGVTAGQQAGVYIKAIIPDKMKVKLIITDVFDGQSRNKDIKYFVNGEHIDYWRYTPDGAGKMIETEFIQK